MSYGLFKMSLKNYSFTNIYICHHNHHIVPLAWIFLTLYHPSLLAGHPTPAHLCKGVHRRTSLMSLSLLLQQCLTCLIHLNWMVLKMKGK